MDKFLSITNAIAQWTRDNPKTAIAIGSLVLGFIIGKVI